MIAGPAQNERISQVILCHDLGASWAIIIMTFNGTGYLAVIGKSPPGTHREPRLYARDTRDNWIVSGLYTYDVVLSDQDPPDIANLSRSPTSPYDNESILVTATITDASPIALASLSYHDGTS
jgi:hypothetical protein